jgi:hypothetical protein
MSKHLLKYAIKRFFKKHWWKILLGLYFLLMVHFVIVIIYKDHMIHQTQKSAPKTSVQIPRNFLP